MFNLELIIFIYDGIVLLFGVCVYVLVCDDMVVILDLEMIECEFSSLFVVEV